MGARAVSCRRRGRRRHVPAPRDNQPGATSWLSGTPSSGQGVVIMTNGALGNPLAMEILVAVALEYNWPIVD